MAELQAVWGWQPALYLFLGGLSAGTFVTAALLFFKDRERNARVVRIACWAALVCLAAGLGLLLTELSNPLRGMMMWQSFSNFASWMTIGAWALALAMVVFGLMALLSTPAVARRLGAEAGRGAAIDRVRRVLAVAGSALALVVAAYTGILLMAAPGVPLWNTLLLPCLFTVSGLDTGVALVEVIAVAIKAGVAPASSRLLSRCVAVLVVAELVVLAVFLGLAAAGGAGVESVFAAAGAQLMLGGPLAPAFWLLVVVLGLALPLAVAVMQLRRGGAGEPVRGSASAAKGTAGGEKTASSATEEKQPVAASSPAMEEKKPGHGLALAGACGALVGGCALRFIILSAGVHGDVIGALVSSL